MTDQELAIMLRRFYQLMAFALAKVLAEEPSINKETAHRLIKEFSENAIEAVKADSDFMEKKSMEKIFGVDKKQN